MQIWFDTEFIEDGKTIELISIGMVREDGMTYYKEVEGVDFSKADKWVHDNVVPHLNGIQASRADIAKDIIKFAGDEPEFWAYYCSYDWVALCQLYGRMIDLPKGWPMFCRDVKQFHDYLGNPIVKMEPSNHNALADAYWTKNFWKILENIDEERSWER